MTDQLTAVDVACLRMLAGAHFGPDSGLVLPSGRRLDAKEAQALTSFYAGGWREDQIRIAQRNQADGEPDSRWCGDASCDLNGMEHGHFRQRHPVFNRAPQRPYFRPVSENDGTFGKPYGEIVAKAVVAAVLIFAAGVGTGAWLW